MDLPGFLTALVSDWISLMSGIASVALTIIGFARKWGQVPRWAFWSAGLVCFLFAAARIWTNEHRKVQAYVNNADAPYVYLQYSPTQSGPSGFLLVNVGQQSALHVQINEIKVGGQSARFGELPSIKNDGQAQATYSLATELAALLEGLAVNADGHAQLIVAVDYWGIDTIRKFRTVCTFDYQKGSGLSLVTYHRDIVSSSIAV